MKITITRRGRRSQLACTRADGTCEIADLGPTLPDHDLAHFIIERKLALTEGFFGRIARGYTVAQLADKEVIQRSPPESLVAEIAARALQALASGSCRPEQFLELVNAELTKWKIPAIVVESETIDEMRTEFRNLVGRFAALGDGAALQLEFLASD